MTSDKLYELWLAHAISGDRECFDRLMLCLGSPAEIYAMTDELTHSGIKLTAKEKEGLLSKELEPFISIMEECEKQNIEILSLEDEIYPERLRQIYDAPLILYVKGTLPEIDDEICVGIVGTRNPSEYGYRAAEKLSKEIACMGAIVVSGMAGGIDTAAHKGALKGDGKTIAVLGTAIDQPYPKENADLYEYISTNGCILSEHAPDAPYQKNAFPRRNRIISGLSLGVMVVEAPEKSGALITARHAAEQNRDVFAVPGPIDQFKSVGNNNLLKAGAKPVTTGLDILAEYVGLLPHRIHKKEREHFAVIPKKKSEPKREISEVILPKEDPVLLVASGEKAFIAKAPKKEEAAPLDDLALSAEEKAVKELLKAQNKTLDQLVVETGLSVANVSVAITMLEIKGHIRALPGGFYSL